MFTVDFWEMLTDPSSFHELCMTHLQELPSLIIFHLHQIKNGLYGLAKILSTPLGNLLGEVCQLEKDQAPLPQIMGHHLLQIYGCKSRVQPPRARDDICHRLQQANSISLRLSL